MGWSKWKGWAMYLLHIESLFVIGIIAIAIYLYWFSRDGRGDLERIGVTFREGIESSRSGLPVKKFKSPKRIKVPRELLSNPSRSPGKKKKKLWKNEERCREIFEEIFEVPFVSTRKEEWLRNPATGEILEIDGYNADIKTPMGKGLGFERDGEQHARYVKFFHKHGPQEFVYQATKDEWKDVQCKKRGVMLIRIPHYVHFSDLERYIKQKLKDKGMWDGVVEGLGYLREGMY